MNYEELVKALRYCASLDECGEDCPLWVGAEDYFCICKLTTDAAAAIEALQAQLPKRVEIVRCGDCKWLFNDSNTFFKPCEVIIPEKDWYCAYGERREAK